MSADPGIPVIVGTTGSTDSGMVPMRGGASPSALKYLNAETLKHGIDTLCEQLQGVFENARKVGNYELTEITIGLEISGEGQILLIGKAGLKGALELKFAPKKPADESAAGAS